MSKAQANSAAVAAVLMTVREVAALDGCSEKTVRRAIASGLLMAMRIGPGARLLRVHPDAHETYRKSQRL